mmetsp:Transcript_59296/g.133551  ORF Transcript_59296/g.133551 Transcript_59296/m.133551 type:complete len:257 (-) Transcript_59296:106-876(-)
MGDEGDAVAGLYMPSTLPAGEEGFRERSANLHADPKMRELKHYTKSHQHEMRLRAAAELEERVLAQKQSPSSAGSSSASAGSLRTDGCEKVNRHMKRLASEKAILPHIGNCADLPDEFRHDVEPKEAELPLDQRQALLRRMNRFHTRLAWRDQMDQNLRRLMQDMELARDDRLKEYADRARCEHLDKIYDWYLTHGMKEARKERAAPPYVRFSMSGPVMPGSLRVAPKTREIASTQAAKGGRGMGHSSSLPTLGSH